MRLKKTRLKRLPNTLSQGGRLVKYFAAFFRMFLNLMQILKTKTVKRRIIMSEKDIHGNNYNAHPETARNKWFNYSDA